MREIAAAPLRSGRWEAGLSGTILLAPNPPFGKVSAPVKQVAFPAKAGIHASAPRERINGSRLSPGMRSFFVSSGEGTLGLCRLAALPMKGPGEMAVTR